ncbi:MAG: hypothetical protein ACYCST_15935 [Acidimicrobiales bacterium]
MSTPRRSEPGKSAVEARARAAYAAAMLAPGRAYREAMYAAQDALATAEVAAKEAYKRVLEGGSDDT